MAPVLLFLSMFVVTLGLQGAIRLGRRLSGTEGSRRSVLDSPLLRWSAGDVFTVRDLLNGGVAIMGRTGSGKTSSSGRTIASAIVRNRNSGGLILAAKSEDKTYWQAIFAKAGRSDDLLLFGPGEPGDLRCNFLDCEREADGETRNLVQFLRIVGDSLRNQEGGKSGDRDRFWELQEDRMLFNAVEIVRLGTGTVTPSLLHEFITGAAQSPEQLLDPRWRQGMHCRTLEAAEQGVTSTGQVHDFQLAAAFWLQELPGMPDRTKGSILAGVMGLLHVYCTGVVRDLVASETTVRPEDLLHRKWLLVNMSPATWGASGVFVSAGWKYLAQRSVLRRASRKDDSFHVIWCDEAQQWVSAFDAQYLAMCRSHRGCMAFLSQSLPGYYSAFGGDKGEHQARSLLANFSHVVMHAVDPVTAEWAAQKLGKRRETFFGGSMRPDADLLDELFGNGRCVGSMSEHYENVLQENIFMNGLRTGGQSRVCDAIILRSGEPFSNGENFLFHTFRQELS